MMNRGRVERLLRMKEQALANSGLRQRALKTALEEAEAIQDAMRDAAQGAEHESLRFMQTAGDRTSWGAFLDLLRRRRLEHAQVVDGLAHALEERCKATQAVWQDAKSWEMLAGLYAGRQAYEDGRIVQKTADDLAASRTRGPGAANV